MARRKNTLDIDDEPVKRRPSTTPEYEENKMIALAMNLVEKRLREGTATSQEVTHFLKLGTVEARLEREKLEKEIALLDQKKKSIERADESSELYTEALEAFKRYSGTSGDDHV